MAPVVAGTCRHCGCTEDRACRLSTGDSCCWVDQTCTVCSNPACMRAEAARKQGAKDARPRRRSSADIHQLILQEAAAKRARYREAARVRGLLRGKDDL